MTMEKVSEMLRKQRRVEGMVHGQSMPRHEMSETLVQRQHSVELQNFIAQTRSEEIGAILEALPPADATLFWQQVSEGRQNEILWEVSDACRERLVGNREPAFDATQINAFELREGRLQQVAIESRKNLEGIRPVWIDLINATKAERSYVGSHFGLPLPDPGDITDLEVSTRFHVEASGDVHLHSNFLLDREGKSRSVPVVFIVHGGILFSLRNEDLPVFRLQRRRAATQPGYASDCNDLLIDLYGADVEYSADSLEDIYTTLGKVGRQVLSEAIRDDLFPSYRKGTDFIQQYIFPGGMLPSRSAFRAAAARQGLAVRHEYAFGLDYARTLAEWRQAFEANWPAIAAQGFDDTFRRLWRMYLCYCEAGFLAGNVDVVQFELSHR